MADATRDPTGWNRFNQRRQTPLLRSSACKLKENSNASHHVCGCPGGRLPCVRAFSRHSPAATANCAANSEIDITDAGNTHAEVQKFLASLEPEARKAVLDGCRHYMQEPVTAHQDTTIPFCEKAL